MHTNPVDAFWQHFAVPPAVAERLRRSGVAEPNALQRAAWRAGLGHPGAGDLLVCAPASAGKGLLAEMLAAGALGRGEKVVWIVPTRALAQSLADRLRRDLAPLGIRVVCGTRDHALPETELSYGRFDLLVGVYEKLRGWLVRDPHAMARVGLLVADELGNLRDPERGAGLDILLTLIREGPYRPRRLGLTMPVPNLEELRDWWGGRYLRCEQRPRPLHEGIYDVSSGRLLWRNRLDGTEGVEAPLRAGELARLLEGAREHLHPAPLVEPMAAALALAVGLAARNEPTLLFAPSRAWARRLVNGAQELAALAPVEPGHLERARHLARRQPAHDHHLLAASLAAGVAGHHADLCWSARRIVEEAFGGGGLRLLVATPTLAQGVNLGVRNVVIAPFRLEPAVGGGGRAVPLERWRYQEQAGRCARCGIGEGFGRAIVAALNGCEGRRLRDHYLMTPPEPLRSALADTPAAEAVMLALGGSVTRSAKNMAELFGRTLAGQQCRAGPRRLNRAWATRGVEACRDQGMVQSGQDLEDAPLELSVLGRMCARRALGPAVLARLKPYLQEKADSVDLFTGDPLPAIWALTLAAPTGSWPGVSPATGFLLPARVREWFEVRDRAIPEALARLIGRPERMSDADFAALSAGFRLRQWIEPIPDDHLERHTRWTLGMLRRAGEAVAWMAHGAGEIHPLLGGRIGPAWHRLGLRLFAGVPEEAIGLVAGGLPELDRGTMISLCREGFTDCGALAEAPLERVTPHTGDAELAGRLIARAREIASETKPPLSEPVHTPTPARHRHLRIDLRSPGIVQAAGREVRLPPLCFDLLASLVEQPGQVQTRASLYVRLWPEGGPEEQQLDAHRRRLIDRLRNVLGEEAQQVAQVVRGIGFRCNLPADTVEFTR